MLYALLFLVRFFPFWAIPAAWMAFEVGLYHYNRRERSRFPIYFVLAASLSVGSVLWIVFEGYWRAGPFLKRFLESFQHP